MKKIMRQPKQRAIALSDQAVHKFIAIEKARPGQSGDLARKRGFARAAVEGVVAVPQGKPSIEIAFRNEAHGQAIRHSFDPSLRRTRRAYASTACRRSSPACGHRAVSRRGRARTS